MSATAIKTRGTRKSARRRTAPNASPTGWRKTGGPCTLNPTPEHWQMVVENRGLIFAALKQCGIPFELRDDCVSEFGYRVMLRCARSFDPAKGMFSTLVFKAMSQAVRQWRAKTARLAAQMPLVSIDAQDGQWTHPAALDDNLRRLERGEAVRQLLAAINPRRRRAVVMRYCAGMKLAEIARRLGVTNEWARQLVNRGLRELRRLAEKKGMSTPVEPKTPTIAP